MVDLLAHTVETLHAAYSHPPEWPGPCPQLKAVVPRETLLPKAGYLCLHPAFYSLSQVTGTCSLQQPGFNAYPGSLDHILHDPLLSAVVSACSAFRR